MIDDACPCCVLLFTLGKKWPKTTQKEESEMPLTPGVYAI